MVRLLSALLVSTLLITAGAGIANAQEATYEYIVYNDTITVSGKVLPAQHIILDSTGEISEILSNTDQDVIPKVYVGRIANETQVQLTDEIYKSFKELVPDGSSKVGTLYKRDLVPKPEEKRGPIFSTMITQQLLHFMRIPF